MVAERGVAAREFTIAGSSMPGLAQCQGRTLLVDEPFLCRAVTGSLHGSSERKKMGLAKKGGRNPQCKGSAAKVGCFEYW